MRLHTAFCTIFCTLPLVCTPLVAQEGEADMAPAKEVEAFHELLGTWEGNGIVRNAPDAEPMKWTATSNATTTLGGHFVQEDVAIEFEGDAAPPPLTFRTLYGFDKETKRWMSYSISNLGTAEAKQVHWVDGKMMTGGSKTVLYTMTGEPQFVVERWSTTFAKDSYSLVGYETIDNGKPFSHVSGSFKRVKVANASFDARKVEPMAPVAKQMGMLQKWSGTYRVKGWMIMMPGTPKTDIAATEVIEPIFGGGVLEFRLKGDPIPNMGTYEGWGAMVWSELDKCYKSLWADNMGGAMLTNAHLRDGKIISGTVALSMGQPVVSSSVITLADDGSIKSLTEHRAFGAAAPVKAFHATYEKK